MPRDYLRGMIKGLAWVGRVRGGVWSLLWLEEGEGGIGISKSDMLEGEGEPAACL